MPAGTYTTVYAEEEEKWIGFESLNVCGTECEFCNGCDNLGGGIVDNLYQPYIDGEKEISEINEQYKRSFVR